MFYGLSQPTYIPANARARVLVGMMLESLICAYSFPSLVINFPQVWVELRELQ